MPKSQFWQQTKPSRHLSDLSNQHPELEDVQFKMLYESQKSSNTTDLSNDSVQIIDTYSVDHWPFIFTALALTTK